MCQMSRYINCIRMLCAAHTHTKWSRSRGQHVIKIQNSWPGYSIEKPDEKIIKNQMLKYGFRPKFWFSGKNSKNKEKSWKRHFFTFSFSYLILYFSSSRFAFWSNSRYLIFAWADSRSRSKSRLFRWRSSISAFQGYFRSKFLIEFRNFLIFHI